MDNPMLSAAQSAKARAYSPYSGFQVGCCIKSAQGNLYTGCNIENASYSLTLCAESSAIAALLMAGENHISEVTIISSGQEICTPCGACRQRFREFAAPNTLIHMYSANGLKRTCTLEELLPHSFGPDHLEKITNV